MGTIELNAEQERSLAENGVVVLSDVAVVRLDVYRQSIEPVEGPRRLPDPPLEGIEVLPPVELPRTNAQKVVGPVKTGHKLRRPDPIGFDE